MSLVEIIRYIVLHQRMSSIIVYHSTVMLNLNILTLLDCSISLPRVPCLALCGLRRKKKKLTGLNICSQNDFVPFPRLSRIPIRSTDKVGS